MYAINVVYSMYANFVYANVSTVCNVHTVCRLFTQFPQKLYIYLQCMQIVYTYMSTNMQFLMGHIRTLRKVAVYLQQGNHGFNIENNVSLQTV